METILEQQRRYHEEKERLMDVMAKEMLTKKSTVSEPWSGPHQKEARGPLPSPRRFIWPQTLPAPHFHLLPMLSRRSGLVNVLRGPFSPSASAPGT